MKVKSMRPVHAGGSLNTGRAVRITAVGPQPTTKAARSTKQVASQAAFGQRSRNKRYADYPMFDVGGGPWRVLAECPAVKHNTGVAGLGRASVDGYGKQHRGVKCICPHAVALVEEYRDRERVKPRSSQATQVTRPKRDPNEPRRYAPPADLSAGLCRSVVGMRIADAVIGTGTGRPPSAARIAEHRRMCERCPVKKACLAEALRLELNDGILGGATAAERKQMMKDGVAA